MTVPQRSAASREASPLPGAAVVARIWRLVAVTTIAGLMYSIFLGASKAGCGGGFTAGGGYVDANGDPTEMAPQCVSLSLHPSPVVMLVLAAIVLWALRRVVRRATDEASAIHILDRAALVAVVVAGASVVIAQVWFAAIPVYGIDGSGTYIWPFPFGSVDFESSPMAEA